MRLRFVFLLPALWFSLAPIHAHDEIFPVAKAYIEDTLKVMQEHFLHKDKIDWPRLKQGTLFQAAGANGRGHLPRHSLCAREARRPP